MSKSEIEEALSAARAYSVTVDTRNDVELQSFLGAVHRDITMLYAAILQLPEVERSDANYARTPYDEWSALFSDLKRILGPLDLYREVFHPYADESEPPVVGSLADAIAAVYGGARRAQLIAAEGSVTDAVWELKFEFEIHSGHHALDAMRALHMHRFYNLDDVHPGRVDSSRELRGCG